MKRFLVCILLLVITGGLILLLGFIDYKTGDASNSFWTYFVLLLLMIGFVYFMSKRKNPITLTDEESKAPVVAFQDFSNHFDWIIVWERALFIIFGMVLYPFRVELVQVMFGEMPFGTLIDKVSLFYSMMGNHVTFWLLMILWIGVCVASIKRLSSNKYVIDGDTLVVQEWRNYKPEQEIRIPMYSIDEVYIVGSRLPLFPCLGIKVGDVERKFASFHGEELGKAILQHKQSLTSK